MTLNKTDKVKLDAIKEAHRNSPPYSLPEGASRKGQNFRKLNVHDLVFPEESKAIFERIDSSLSEIAGMFSLSDLNIILLNAVELYIENRKAKEQLILKEKQDQARELIASLKAQGLTNEEILALGQS
mgnify:CR=1 FL=1